MKDTLVSWKKINERYDIKMNGKYFETILAGIIFLY